MFTNGFHIFFRMDKVRAAHNVCQPNLDCWWKLFEKLTANNFRQFIFINDRICVDVSYVTVSVRASVYAVCYTYVSVSSQSCLAIIMVFLVSVLLTNATRSRLISTFFSSLILILSLCYSQYSHALRNNIIHWSPPWKCRILYVCVWAYKLICIKLSPARFILVLDCVVCVHF